MAADRQQPLRPRALRLVGENRSQARLYGPEFEFLIVEIEANCDRRTWERSSARPASIDVPNPACNAIEVLSTSEDIVTAFVIRSSEAKRFQMTLRSLKIQMKEMKPIEMRSVAVVPISTALENKPSVFQKVCKMSK